MTPARRPAHRVSWHALTDGVAHALVHGPGATPRYACGRPRHDERFDWPTRSHCPTCEEEVAIATAR